MAEKVVDDVDFLMNAWAALGKDGQKRTLKIFGAKMRVQRLRANLADAIDELATLEKRKIEWPVTFSLKKK